VLSGVKAFKGRLKKMSKLRLIGLAFTGVFSAGLAVSANASSSELYSSEKQTVRVGNELVVRATQQTSMADLISDEAMLLGSAIIGLIGITIMRKTMH
jgi:hypothetical protein